MKKLSLLIVAIIAMAQMNATTLDAATSEANAAEVAADNDSEKTYEHPFMDDDKSTKHWTLTTNGFYLGMGVSHNWDAINNTFEVGLLNIGALKYNSLHGQVITLGVGIHHKSYSIKRPFMLMRPDGSQVVTVETYPSENVDIIKDRSSNLNLWALQFPLMFKQRIVKKLDITVAGIMNWNYLARVDNHFEMNKVEYDTKYRDLKQNKVNFDFLGILSWDEYGIYCRYSPGKVLKDDFGPEIKNTWTLGFIMFM